MHTLFGVNLTFLPAVEMLSKIETLVSIFSIYTEFIQLTTNNKIVIEIIYCWVARGKIWLSRYVTRTNISFFDPSPNDQRTEHSCA